MEYQKVTWQGGSNANPKVPPGVPSIRKKEDCCFARLDLVLKKATAFGQWLSIFCE